jgi:hypothetical protein
MKEKIVILIINRKALICGDVLMSFHKEILSGHTANTNKRSDGLFCDFMIFQWASFFPCACCRNVFTACVHRLCVLYLGRNPFWLSCKSSFCSA